jgi:hypothetical protein
MAAARPIPAVVDGEGSGGWVLEREGSMGIRFGAHRGREAHQNRPSTAAVVRVERNSDGTDVWWPLMWLMGVMEQHGAIEGGRQPEVRRRWCGAPCGGHSGYITAHGRFLAR